MLKQMLRRETDELQRCRFLALPGLMDMRLRKRLGTEIFYRQVVLELRRFNTGTFLRGEILAQKRFGVKTFWRRYLFGKYHSVTFS